MAGLLKSPCDANANARRAFGTMSVRAKKKEGAVACEIEGRGGGGGAREGGTRTLHQGPFGGRLREEFHRVLSHFYAKRGGEGSLDASCNLGSTFFVISARFGLQTERKGRRHTRSTALCSTGPSHPAWTKPRETLVGTQKTGVFGNIWGRMIFCRF